MGPPGDALHTSGYAKPLSKRTRRQAGLTDEQLQRSGDEAVARLFPLAYDELRRVAHRQLSRQGTDHTLGTTALVHETYLRLAHSTLIASADRAHFLAAAARAMRHILIDYARKHGTVKRGGDWQRVPLEGQSIDLGERAGMLLSLDDALTRLGALDPRLSKVVECRFFGGLTEEETAESLGVTSRTVRRDWIKAKGWLFHELSADPLT